MNFLAHIYLSGPSEEITIGNFIGDFVKGNKLGSYSDHMALGIRLHRQIDHFTDTHEEVRKSKLLLRGKYRHYAPVIVDMFYDHFLAAGWKDQHPTELKVFTTQFYELTEKYLDQIPQSAVEMLRYMKPGNWLYNYQFMEGINKALTGMSRRTTFDSKMDEAVHDLQKHYEAFSEHFEKFFPQLIDFSNDYIIKHKNAII